MDEDRITKLDLEMEVLRALTQRTPRGERLCDREEENRNDAVVGSSENFQEQSGDPRMLTRKFVSVDDLFLDPEDPIQRRYASTRNSDRNGSRQNQYFPRG